MLKGSEALVLALSGVGLARAFSAPGAMSGPLGKIALLLERSIAPECHAAAAGAAQAGAAALCGALLSHHPTVALLDPLGVAASLGSLGSLGLISEFSSGVVILEGLMPGPGLDSRPAVAALSMLPILEPGSVDEIYHLARLSYAISEEGGVPVVLRIASQVLTERGEVQKQLFWPPVRDATPASLLRDDGPRIRTPETEAYQMDQRLGLLARLEPLSSALTATSQGRQPRGVVIAGHLGHRVHMMASARGVSVLRLGMSWPLPEQALRAFLTGLSEVMVLEEGAPFLLTHIQALCQRAGLSLRVMGPARPVSRADEASVLGALSGFAGQEVQQGGSPAYPLQPMRKLLNLRPQPDDRGEIQVEPWPLHIARLRRQRARPLPARRARLLELLREIERPTVLVGGSAFSALWQVLDVQLPLPAATCAGALSAARLIEEAGVRTEHPQVVALIDGGDGEEQAGLLDNLLHGRDVLHVAMVPRQNGEGEPAAERLRQLRALGMEWAVADLAEEAGVEHAIAYLGQRSGPRLLVCYEEPGPQSTIST